MRRRYFQDRVADLEGVCHEDEFTYWAPAAPRPAGIRDETVAIRHPDLRPWIQRLFYRDQLLDRRQKLDTAVATLGRPGEVSRLLQEVDAALGA